MEKKKKKEVVQKEQEFFFPHCQKTVKATNADEALKKLNNKKNDR